MTLVPERTFMTRSRLCRFQTKFSVDVLLHIGATRSSPPVYNSIRHIGYCHAKVCTRRYGCSNSDFSEVQ